MSEQNGNENKGSDPKLGDLKKENISDVWKREEDFSEWLAENISRLAEILNIDLDSESVQIEDHVGDFFADISARTDTGKPVVIENQYGTTDHRHMGQLLTYAAGIDVQIAVWIAEYFRDEHRQTLEWLNQSTGEDRQFFGIEAKIFRIDDSRPVLHLDLVVSPNNWAKGVKHGPNKNPQLLDYLEKLKKEHPDTANKVRYHWDKTLRLASGVANLSFWILFRPGEKTDVSLQLSRSEKAVNKVAFDWLKDKFGDTSGFSWERRDGIVRSEVKIEIPGSLDDTEENLRVLREKHADALRKLQSVFTHEQLSKAYAHARSQPESENSESEDDSEE